MRDLRITKQLTDLGKNTDSGFHQVFTAGVKAALKIEDLSQNTIEDWPGYLQRAYATQELIGWNQVLYGRIGVHWEEISKTSVDQSKTADTFTWTSKAIRLLWDFGLAVWETRNQLLFGTGSGPTVSDKQCVDELIQRVYRDIRPTETQCISRLFDRTETDLLRLSHQNKMAWLEQIKFLYPINYKDIVEHKSAQFRSTEEDYRHKQRVAGINLGNILL